MLPEPKVPQDTLNALRAAEHNVRWWRDLASAQGVASLGLKKGQIVRDRDTGARYRVESVNVWIRENDQTPHASIMGRRVYKTGRRDAWATTVRCGPRFEIEPDEEI